MGNEAKAAESRRVATEGRDELFSGRIGEGTREREREGGLAKAFQKGTTNSTGERRGILKKREG